MHIFYSPCFFGSTLNYFFVCTSKIHPHSQCDAVGWRGHGHCQVVRGESAEGVAAGVRLSRGLFGEAAVRAKVWTGLRSGAELEEAEYASGVCYLQGAAGRVECGAGGGGHRN